jgi:hypothetical protein
MYKKNWNNCLHNRSGTISIIRKLYTGNGIQNYVENQLYRLVS